MDHFLKTSTVHKIHILEKSVRRVNNHPARNMMCTKPAKALISRIYETGSMTKIKWFYMNIGIKVETNQPAPKMTQIKYQYHCGLGKTEVAKMTLNTRTYIVNCINAEYLSHGCIQIKFKN